MFSRRRMRNGFRAVVKLVPKAPGADRDLRSVKLDGVRGVVPIIDSGEHDNAWALVMPRAEESLSGSRRSQRRRPSCNRRDFNFMRISYRPG